MGKRPLSAEEAALWARVIASVRPIRPPAPAKPAAAPAPAPTAATPAPAPARKVRGRVPAPLPLPVKPAAPRPLTANTLDGSWDRDLSRGRTVPDSSIDLHGHTLSSAYARLDAALDFAIQSGQRVLLVITGKPPRAESERPHARGAIRAAIGDWLAGSRHGPHIAAVRPAHPRHGGNGALYVILRRSTGHRNR
ncbi:Smr/MutS family protein [Sphingomonas sp. H39-1-10]|uniref:Smr/MutS family protein n=1 Tax=Sphingomonas pollutisoli TaxID=3030829 RepID=UPI0023B9D789|nr:Smr/MutS family protein [Sphingomonas pollutisoli]MDF0488812.1 Smr/MutS family protein [Sphingomonas pollutisoli]